MSYKIHIPVKFPSFNEYIDECRTHWRAGAKVAKKYKSLSAGYILQQINKDIRLSGGIDKPVILHFTWHEGNRKRDKSNVAYAKKFIEDALVSVGILKDDGADYVDGFTDKFEYGSDWGVTVEIEEARGRDDNKG